MYLSIDYDDLKTLERRVAFRCSGQDGQAFTASSQVACPGACTHRLIRSTSPGTPIGVARPGAAAAGGRFADVRGRAPAGRAGWVARAAPGRDHLVDGERCSRAAPRR